MHCWCLREGTKISHGEYGECGVICHPFTHHTYRGAYIHSSRTYRGFEYSIRRVSSSYSLILLSLPLNCKYANPPQIYTTNKQKGFVAACTLVVGQVLLAPFSQWTLCQVTRSAIYSQRLPTRCLILYSIQNSPTFHCNNVVFRPKKANMSEQQILCMGQTKK